MNESIGPKMDPKWTQVRNLKLKTKSLQISNQHEGGFCRRSSGKINLSIPISSYACKSPSMRGLRYGSRPTTGPG
jgi:hypothetical protein